MAEEKQIDKICKNCLYWKKAASYEGEREISTCKLSVNIYSTYEYIEDPYHDRTNENNRPTIGKNFLGAYHDGMFDEDTGVVVTGPKFRCNRWQERRGRMIK